MAKATTEEAEVEAKEAAPAPESLNMWTILVVYHANDPQKRVEKEIGTFFFNGFGDVGFASFIDAYGDIRAMVQKDVPFSVRGSDYGVTYKRLPGQYVPPVV
jgi:hypothetical protein